MSAAVHRRALAVLLATILTLGACGDDGGSSDDAAASNGDAQSSDEVASDPVEPTDESDDDGGGDGDAASFDDAAKGSATIDGEGVTLYSAQCDLDDVELAAGSGTQQLDVNSAGRTDSGVEVMITASRHAEGGMFGGDGVQVTFIGDRADGINSVMATFDDERLSVDGSTVRATDLSLADPVSGTELIVSFEVRC